MKRLIAFLLFLASSASAAELRIEGPESAVLPAILSVYSADSPYGEPVGTLDVGKPADIAPGRYVYGFGANDWRSKPFVLEGVGYTIRLGAILLAAPPGSSATFVAFGGAQSRLMAIVSENESVLLPAGNIRLKRDLAQQMQIVKVDSSQITRVELGALRINAESIPPGSAVFLANAKSRELVAVLDKNSGPTALFSGQMVMTTSSLVPMIKLSIEANKTQEIELGWIEWRDALGMANVQIDADLPFLPKQATFALNTDDDYELTVGDESFPLILSKRSSMPVWRYDDGALSLGVGLRLELDPNFPKAILPGEPANVKLVALDDLRLSAELTVGEQVIDLGDHSLSRENSVLALKIPPDIQGETAATLALRHESGRLSGFIEGLHVQQPLALEVSDLRIAIKSKTTVDLQWKTPDEEGVVGVHIFRGSESRSILGDRPQTGNGYSDIGLSAGRKYTYRVCTVDLFERLGPCARISLQTER